MNRYQLIRLKAWIRAELPQADADKVLAKIAELEKEHPAPKFDHDDKVRIMRDHPDAGQAGRVEPGLVSIGEGYIHFVELNNGRTVTVPDFWLLLVERAPEPTDEE